ncbi:DUF262 domain-containing protein [Microbispora hainanensis]|uniref:DUF262 domain-containing protein n=1 Tax=Microbispora hainanensis TaxID=568844 RepID=UPI003862FEB2
MPDRDGKLRSVPERWELEALIEKVASGAIRVPLFSRPFVWRPRQMTALFESIEDGYPIGSLVLWEPADEVESMNEIGGIPIPPPPPGLPICYVLDRHQRLATLFGCLRAPASAQASADAWMWRIYRVLGLRLSRESAIGTRARSRLLRIGCHSDRCSGRRISSPTSASLPALRGGRNLRSFSTRRTT